MSWIGELFLELLGAIAEVTAEKNISRKQAYIILAVFMLCLAAIIIYFILNS